MPSTADMKDALARIAEKYAAEVERPDLRFFTVAVRVNPRTGRPGSYRVDCTYEGELDGRAERDFTERPVPSRASAFSRSGARA